MKLSEEIKDKIKALEIISANDRSYYKYDSDSADAQVEMLEEYLPKIEALEKENEELKNKLEEL